MPKLWTETIEAHRREVQDAILATAAALIGEQGLRSVTMSRIAEETGIGRATLYKYFPSVEAILVAWHTRQVSDHLTELERIRDQVGDARQRLAAVLEAYALLNYQHHRTELAALVQQNEEVARARGRLSELIQGLLIAAAATCAVRSDVAPAELTRFCLHALAAASSMPSEAAVRRLVTVTLAGLAPPA